MHVLRKSSKVSHDPQATEIERELDRAKEAMKIAREALEKIESAKVPELSNDHIDRSLQLAGLWTGLKFIAKEALSRLDGKESK